MESFTICKNWLESNQRLFPKVSNKKSKENRKRKRERKGKIEKGPAAALQPGHQNGPRPITSPEMVSFSLSSCR
jgi:hypothetical protein